MIELSAVIASAAVVSYQVGGHQRGMALHRVSRVAKSRNIHPHIVALSSLNGCSDGFGGGEGYSPGARLGRACAWRAHTAVLGFPSAAAGEPRPSKPPASASRQRKKHTRVPLTDAREKKKFVGCIRVRRCSLCSVFVYA